jgi:hypothetical protein
MGRKEAASRGQGSSTARLHVDRHPGAWWRPGVKGSGIVAAVVVLLGIVGFAVIREATVTARGPNQLSPKPDSRPPRPAFTAAEEAYIRALWPIHGDVERTTVRMSLGQIFYKINDMDKPTLKGRVDEALSTYRRSEARLLALEPPPSVKREHADYLDAIRLFHQSAIEVLKMFQDGRDDHMNAAYPLSQKASDKIREVGGKFWPDEFPPN